MAKKQAISKSQSVRVKKFKDLATAMAVTEPDAIPF
jgi:hypothetical protein